MGPVFARRKGGERSAYAEMVLVSSLVRLGYSPCFEPPLNDNVLDAKCEVEGETVYFEVAAPEYSKSAIDSQQQADELKEKLDAVVSASRRCSLQPVFSGTYNLASSLPY